MLKEAVPPGKVVDVRVEGVHRLHDDVAVWRPIVMQREVTAVRSLRKTERPKRCRNRCHRRVERIPLPAFRASGGLFELDDHDGRTPISLRHLLLR